MSCRSETSTRENNRQLKATNRKLKESLRENNRKLKESLRESKEKEKKEKEAKKAERDAKRKKVEERQQKDLEYYGSKSGRVTRGARMHYHIRLILCRVASYYGYQLEYKEDYLKNMAFALTSNSRQVNTEEETLTCHQHMSVIAYRNGYDWREIHDNLFIIKYVKELW
jgi:hypothetical protein